MPFAVYIQEKGGERRHQEFDKNEVTIGRVQGNDIVLPKQNVSKKHSRIVVKDGKFIIVDLKSTNGTYVNGRKIASPMVIKETDKIYIGDFILSTKGATDEDSAANEEAAAQPPPPELSAKVPSPSTPSSPAAPAAPKITNLPEKVVTTRTPKVPTASQQEAPAQNPPPVRVTEPPLKEASKVVRSEQPKPGSAFGELVQAAEAEGHQIPTAINPFEPLDQKLFDAVKALAKKQSSEDELDFLVQEVSDLGPLRDLLTEKSNAAIFVDGAHQLSVKTSGSLENKTASFSSEDAVRAVGQRLINWSRGSWQESGCNGVRDGLRISFTKHGARSHLAITRYENEISQFEELVENGQLSASMAEFLLTALMLNRTLCISSSQSAGARKLTETLIQSCWSEERLVVIDPANLLVGIDTSPRLNQPGNVATICEQARLLQPDHLVVNQVNGQSLLAFGELAAGLSGGAIFLMKTALPIGHFYC